MTSGKLLRKFLSLVEENGIQPEQKRLALSGRQSREVWGRSVCSNRMWFSKKKSVLSLVDLFARTSGMNSLRKRWVGMREGVNR